MIAALLLALSGPLTPPPEELAGHFYGAVWFDLERNALIGNGNWPAALWYQGGDDEARVLHIQNLRCRRTGGRRYQCAFDLYRDGGPVMTIYNEMAPDRLSCTATLVHEREEGEWVWFVRHSPPSPTGGHSRTSLQCDPPGADPAGW